MKNTIFAKLTKKEIIHLLYAVNKDELLLNTFKKSRKYQNNSNGTELCYECQGIERKLKDESIW